VPIVGVRRLSQAQIDTIQRWVHDGAAEGAPAATPAVPPLPSDWQLGTPDVVLTMPRAYVLSPGSEDVYRNVILHGNVPNNAFVRAVEFQTNGSPIHHAVIRLARGALARARDGEGGQPGFDGMSSDLLQDPEGQLLGWAPGRGPMVSPENMSWTLEKGTAVAVELHLIPSKQPRNVQPRVALYFSSTAPVQRPVMGQMSAKLIDIPPGDANYVVTDRFQMPVQADLIGLFPHAHLLGKAMFVTATPPGGKPRTLLDIRHWNFHWQQDYRFVTPVSLPKGTVIDMRFSYDNSAGNPANPSNPPVRVRLGSRSKDEMANLSLQLLTASPADTVALRAAFFEKRVVSNIAYGEMRVREAPESVPDRVLLGSSYVQARRYAEAVPQLEAALALDPRHAIAHGQLGGAYQGLGRWPLAIQHFEQSALLAPKDARTHLNLAEALHRSGRIRDAEAAYRRAIAIDPDSFEAHVKLADLLSTDDRVRAALPHLRRVVELRPMSADTHSDLGGALFLVGLTKEAEEHLLRALELDPNHAGARQNLAVLRRGRQ
jgi:Flp pilus assembly protein TadD